MNLPDFAYVRPKTLDEARALLRDDPEARALAGGQTLIPAMKQRLSRPSRLVDLAGIDGLTGIEVTDSLVSVGAMTCHADTAAHPEVRAAIPALSHLASGIAHPQVRHRGTMGGSIANNDPAADYPAAVVGLGAEIETTARRIPADAFFTAMFETALEPGELVVRIHFPIPHRAGYHKIPSQASGYVTTGCFIADTTAGVRVAVNGAGPVVFRQTTFEEALAAEFSPAALDGLTQTADGLNTDIHANAAYRAHLVSVAARSALAMALSQTREDTPA
ncbi:MAG: xanthine dehydrogenase family protein subunit M [Paracoccaceae bacterium]